LEFYETETEITEVERDGLAQFVHILTSLALRGKSTEWRRSAIERDSSAFRSLESHFGYLKGWDELAPDGQNLNYRSLASFLMQPYPPRSPDK